MTKTIALITLPLLLSFSLSGQIQAAMDSQHEHHGHGMHGESSMNEDQGTGKIVEIDSERRRVKLDHGPLDNIGMDAMVMFFGIAGDVDLTSYQVGDDVAFKVRRGRDGSYRLYSLCNTGTEGEDCLK
jgi:Cu/Ag efflux protein CusF